MTVFHAPGQSPQTENIALVFAAENAQQRRVALTGTDCRKCRKVRSQDEFEVFAQSVEVLGNFINTLLIDRLSGRLSKGEQFFLIQTVGCAAEDGAADKTHCCGRGFFKFFRCRFELF